jgi:hypothetical protein
MTPATRKAASPMTSELAGTTDVPAIPDCYKCGLAAAEHHNGVPCPASDPAWNCPDHNTEILWTPSDPGLDADRYECPVPGCPVGKWVD